MSPDSQMKTLKNHWVLQDNLTKRDSKNHDPEIPGHILKAPEQIQLI